MGKSPPTRAIVYVVDDDVGARTGLCRLLETAGYETRSYASAGDFLLHDPGDAPGCVLLDIRMPGPSGLELQETLAKREEAMPVIFLTGHADVPNTIRALKAGASDFLTKPVEHVTLLAAVDKALAQNAARRGELQALRELRARYAALTPREREVLSHVVAGKLNKQIAADLGIAERTVKGHRAEVMEKMQVESLADLVRVASQLGLSGPSSAPASEPTTRDRAPSVAGHR